MRTLVTGGAGYIGSHVVRLLRERGDDVVVVDDLSTGCAERLRDTPMQRLDLVADGADVKIREILGDEAVESVIHFAARKRVDESVARPDWYREQNMGSLTNVLRGMEMSGVRRFVFSSSAAVYGKTEGAAIAESAPALPLNPYGETKLAGEHLIADSARGFGLSSISLRYFNVAGSGWRDLGDRAVLNLVPMVFERIGHAQPPLIFGDDYDTPDGTCIRDYVHVRDLAEAHIAALDHLDHVSGHDVFNVGTGVGTSVKQMIDTILRATGSSLRPEMRPRRIGDPACVVASPARIAERMGWRARFGIEDIVASAWEAHTSAARS